MQSLARRSLKEGIPNLINPLEFFASPTAASGAGPDGAKPYFSKILSTPTTSLHHHLTKPSP